MTAESEDDQPGRPGRYYRRFRFPGDTDGDRITAAYDNGVLGVRLPVAGEIITDVVFRGTDNVGEIARPLTSVGGGVAGDTEHDVRIGRCFSPTPIREIEPREGYPTGTA